MLLRKIFLLFVFAAFVSSPTFGGWWTNYEDEGWCHRLEAFKYCLPGTFRLERLEDAHLEFIDERDAYASIFAKYLGNDTLQEILSEPPVPQDLLSLDSDTYINGLRLIRYMPNENTEEHHNLMVVFVIFPDESVIQIFGPKSSQTESSISAFINPIPIR